MPPYAQDVALRCLRLNFEALGTGSSSSHFLSYPIQSNHSPHLTNISNKTQYHYPILPLWLWALLIRSAKTEFWEGRERRGELKEREQTKSWTERSNRQMFCIELVFFLCYHDEFLLTGNLGIFTWFYYLKIKREYERNT